MNNDVNKLTSTRDGFGVALEKLGETNKNIVVLTADLGESTRVDGFHKKYPDRFIEVGVAEENMIGVATGLALTNKIPFASSYATFIINNALGPIRTLCYTNANVKIISHHTGFSATFDGATHQALEDISTMNSLPNMTIVAPCDAQQTYQATLAIAQWSGPCYLRLSKNKVKNITNKATPFTIGKANLLKKGSDLSIIVTGSMTTTALEIAEKLQDQYSIEVLNIHTIKPIDTQAIIKTAKNTKAVLTLEEQQKNGGLGSIVASILAQENLSLAFKILGVDDSFGGSGTREELLQKHQLDNTSIIKQLEQLMLEKAMI